MIRLDSNFLIEYKAATETKKARRSPVVHIGEGAVGKRLYDHHLWIQKLHLDLLGVSIDVKICFPQDADGTPLNKQLEAHLLTHFQRQFGQLPYKNRQRQTLDGGLSFPRAGRQQVLGHGKGKNYAWAIKPLVGRVAVRTKMK